MMTRNKYIILVIKNLFAKRVFRRAREILARIGYTCIMMAYGILMGRPAGRQYLETLRKSEMIRVRLQACEK
jgi:hypothetical protein